MSTSLSDITNGNTFGQWKDRTNQIITALGNTVTMGDSEINTGNLVLTGDISATGTLYMDVIDATPGNAADIITLNTDVKLNGDLRINSATAAETTYNLSDVLTWTTGTNASHTRFDIKKGTALFRIDETAGSISGANLTIEDSLLPAIISSDITGNSATTDRWASSRTVTFGGTSTSDVTGSFSIRGDAAVNNVPLLLKSTISANTTGNAATSTKWANSSAVSFVEYNAAEIIDIGNGTTTEELDALVLAAGDVIGSFSIQGNGNVTDVKLNLRDTILSDTLGNAATSSEWADSRTISFADVLIPAVGAEPAYTLSTDVTGSLTIKGNSDVTTQLVVKDNSHRHTWATLSNTTTNDALWPQAFTPSSHVHGRLSNDGKILVALISISEVALSAGKQYTITSIGSTTQVNWNVIAGTSTSPIIYAIGNTFTSAGSAKTTGTGQVSLAEIGTSAGKVIVTGASGLLVAKASGTAGQYLSYDGSWATPPDTDTNTMYSHPTNGYHVPVPSTTQVTDGYYLKASGSTSIGGEAAEKKVGTWTTPPWLTDSSEGKTVSIANSTAAQSSGLVLEGYDTTHPTKLTLSNLAGAGVKSEIFQAADLNINSQNSTLLRGSASGLCQFGTGGTMKAQIAFGTGAIISVGNITAYGSVSDRTRKENIVKIDGALDKVSKISGYTFNYIGDDTPMTGVIAQELEEVLPQVVYETELLDGTTSKAVRHGNIVGLLIEAIKELKAEIDVLKSDR